MKAQFLPLFNVNLSQLQLNSTSTHFQLNFHSISSQPYFNLRFKSTSASNQPQPQLNLNHNLNSIWLWHKSNPILFDLFLGDVLPSISCSFCPLFLLSKSLEMPELVQPPSENWSWDHGVNAEDDDED